MRNLGDGLDAHLHVELAFFSPQGVGRADVILREITSRFKVPVLVETFTTVAAGKEKGLEAMPAGERTRFYAKVMKEPPGRTMLFPQRQRPSCAVTGSAHSSHGIGRPGPGTSRTELMWCP